jgi:iron complex outermembrane receptor protein
MNLPLSNSAMRFAFIASEGDGYIRNSVDDRRFAEDDYWGLRGSYRVDVGALHVDVVAQHIRDDGGAGDLWTPNPNFLPDPHDIRLTTVTLENPYLISEIDNLNVLVEDELGFATLRSITGYVRSEVRNIDDCAGIPPLQGCVRSAMPNKFEQWSQEFQLVFPRRGAVEGIAGAYYADSDVVQNLYQLFPLGSELPLSDSHSTYGNPAAALFGQATVHFTDRWSTTAGLRFSWEKQQSTTIGTGLGDSPTLLVGENESDNLSWLLNLEYSASDDLMLYAGVSTGYKSGGTVLGPSDSGAPDVYDPEYIRAFEAGAKSQWLSGRLALNAAAFFYDYDDLQVSTVGENADVGIENAGKAQIYGIDADMNYIVSERWSVSGGVVWVPKREFVKYRNEAGNDLSGNDLVRAPEWSVISAVGYERPLGNLGRLSVTLEYSYRSAYFNTPENMGFVQDSFGLLNAYLRFEAASNAWYAFASGHNLTNEDYFNQVFLQSSPGYPDTYEIGVGFRF